MSETKPENPGNAERFYFLAVPAFFLLVCVSLGFYRCDFPLNDDWAYLSALKRTLESGKVILSDWGSSTQLTHLLSGLVFSKIFGFHLGLVKLVSIIYFCLFLVFFQKILEEFGLDKKSIILAALTAAFAPVNLVLSLSFMTDITYLFWSTLALYLFMRREKGGGEGFLYGAAVVSGVAYISRQLGLVLPAAFLFYLFARKRLDLKSFLKITLPFAVFFLGHWFWFKYAHGPTWASENYVAAATLGHLSDFGVFAADFFERTLSTLIEGGLMVFPLALPALFFFKRKISGPGGEKIKSGAAPLVLCVACFAVYAYIRGFLPYMENTIGRFGIGTPALNGWQFKETGFFGKNWFWGLSTALGAVSAGVLLYSSFFSRACRQEKFYFLFLANFLLHFAVSAAGSKYFDRYLVNFLPFFILSAAVLLKNFRVPFFVPALLLIPVFAVSFSGTLDYMRWNLAKWELAGRISRERGVDQSEIANAFDHDAWFNYDGNMKKLRELKSLREIGEWEWQKFMSYRVIITANPNPPPGFVLEDKLEYDTPLSSKKGVIYAFGLKK